jgi:hypothetical protein
MTRAISVYSLWSSGAAAFYGKDSLTVEERKKEWARFEKKYPEEFAKLQRKADRENKKSSPKKASPKKTSPKKASSKLVDRSVKELKEALTRRGVDFADCVEKADLVRRLKSAADMKPARKQSLTTLEKKRATATRNLAKATQALADIEAEIKKRMEESSDEDSSDEDSSDEDSSDEDSD